MKNELNTAFKRLDEILKKIALNRDEHTLLENDLKLLFVEAIKANESKEEG